MDLFEILDGEQLKLGICIFVLIVGLCNLFINRSPEKKADKKISRLKNIREFDENQIEENIDLTNPKLKMFNNYVKPYVEKNKSLYERLIKLLGIDRTNIKKKLTAANITDYNEEHIAILRVGLFVLSVILTFALFLLDGSEGIVIGVLLVAASLIFPSSVLERKVKERQDKIIDVFPEMLRLMVDATSTGHTIEDAIIRVTRKYPNELSGEFNKVQEETRVTNDWILALENMALRCGIFELNSFVSEVKTTKIRGNSISDVLLSFASKMDKETTIRITERARKKSTTLLFPVMIFLFVPMILMIMLPALNQVMSTL